MFSRLLFAVSFLSVLCGCVSDSHIFLPRFFSGAVDPLEQISQVEKMMSQRKYRVMNPQEYREIFGTDQQWTAEGDLMPLELVFLPSEKQQSYRMRGYLLNALQRERELILFEVMGRIPAEDQGLRLVKLVRQNGRDETPVFLPRTPVLKQLESGFRQMLAAQKVRWDSILKPMPQWSNARFEKETHRKILLEKDLVLFGVRQRAGFIEFLYNIPCQTVSAGGFVSVLENLHVSVSPEGKVLAMSTELSRQISGYEIFSEITREDRRKITAEMLMELAQLKLPQNVRNGEKFRFAAITGEPFDKVKEYLKEKEFAFHNVFVRNWQLNLPFDERQGCYTVYQNGAFYYLVQEILPVSEDKAVVQGFLTWADGKNGGIGLILLMEKGFSGWEKNGEWVIQFR